MYNAFFPYFCDIKNTLLHQLPSNRHGGNFVSDVKRIFYEGLGQTLWDETDSGDDPREIELQEKDYDYVYSRLTSSSYYQFFGYAHVALATLPCTFSFYFVTGGLAMYCLNRLGVDFFE